MAPKLELRPASDRDMDFLSALASDPSVEPFLAPGPHGRNVWLPPGEAPTPVSVPPSRSCGPADSRTRTRVEPR